MPSAPSTSWTRASSTSTHPPSAPRSSCPSGAPRTPAMGTARPAVTCSTSSASGSPSTSTTAGACSAPRSTPTPRRHSMAQLEERFVSHGGGRVRYLIGGSGPALVLCHGFLGSAENFETWFDELSRIRTLVLPDLPGCVASPALQGARHTAARLAVAVDAAWRDARAVRFD